MEGCFGNSEIRRMLVSHDGVADRGETGLKSNPMVTIFLIAALGPRERFPYHHLPSRILQRFEWTLQELLLQQQSFPSKIRRVTSD